jgi:predicted outer membrane protein
MLVAMQSDAAKAAGASIESKMGRDACPAAKSALPVLTRGERLMGRHTECDKLGFFRLVSPSIRSRRMKRIATWNLGLSLALAGLITTSVLAQQAQPPASRNTQTRPQAAAVSSGGPNERLDEFIASCLILENQNEVAAAKLAQQHAKSSDIKSFAQEMEKDHSQFISELAKFAKEDFKNRKTENRGSESASGANRTDQPGSTNRTAKADPARGGEVRPAAGAPGTTVAAGAAQNRGEDLLQTQLQIKHEIADQCLHSASHELSGKKSAEFDECYIGMQIGMHMKMIDELKVLERHVSPQLKSTLSDGRQTAENHLEKAKKLHKDLASHSSGDRKSDK